MPNSRLPREGPSFDKSSTNRFSVNLCNNEQQSPICSRQCDEQPGWEGGRTKNPFFGCHRPPSIYSLPPSYHTLVNLVLRCRLLGRSIYIKRPQKGLSFYFKDFHKFILVQTIGFDIIKSFSINLPVFKLNYSKKSLGYKSLEKIPGFNKYIYSLFVINFFKSIK